MTPKEYFKNDKGNLILLIVANVLFPIMCVVTYLFPSEDRSVDVFVYVICGIFWFVYNLANYINYRNKKNKNHR